MDLCFDQTYSHMNIFVIGILAMFIAIIIRSMHNLLQVILVLIKCCLVNHKSYPILIPPVDYL